MKPYELKPTKDNLIQNFDDQTVHTDPVSKLVLLARIT